MKLFKIIDGEIDGISITKESMYGPDFNFIRVHKAPIKNTIISDDGDVYVFSRPRIPRKIKKRWKKIGLIPYKLKHTV